MIIDALGQDENAAHYIGGRLGVAFFRPYEVLGIFEPQADGSLNLIGGFVFTGRSAANVDVSFYGPGCLSLRVLRAACHLVFREWKCERATARIRRTNRAMRVLMERGGWTLEGCQRHFWGGTKYDDAMLYGLLASDCRWLKGKTNGRAGHARSESDRASAGRI